MSATTSAGLAAALCRHAHVEFLASSTYLAASMWFSKKGLNGFAKWSAKEACEERQHGLGVLNFLMQRTPEAVTIHAIDAPRNTFESAADVVEHLLGAEKSTTASINGAIFPDSRISLSTRI